METKHTKGEWAVNSANKQEVNSYNGISIADCSKSVVIEVREKEANAKLIAAAPEMLEAIIKAKEMMETARKYMPKSIKNSDRYEFENANAAIGNAIYKATK